MSHTVTPLFQEVACIVSSLCCDFSTVTAGWSEGGGEGGLIDAVMIIKGMEFNSKFRNKDRAVTMTHRKIAVVDTREKIWQSIVLVSILHNLAVPY